MMPASTTLASSHPRWGDQKAPITATPETSQNPFRHLVGRDAPCKREQKSPAGHATARHGPVRPASLVIAIARLSSRGAAGQDRPKDGGDDKCLAQSNKSSTGAKLLTSEKPYRQRGAISCANALEFIFMKLSAPLAVAALAFGVWAWHVGSDCTCRRTSASWSPRYAA